MEETATRISRLALLGHSLFTVLGHIEESIDLAARTGNMHPTDMRCIAMLMTRAEPTSPKDIISYLGLSSGSGTALFDRLEAAGYVRRIPNPEDRRSILIVLDEEAAAGPIELVSGLQARYRSGLDDFTENDLDVITRYLDRVSQLTLEARQKVAPQI